jgi:UDP-N-acetylglucosamine--N-acetylmuramyl-(pentapeptide) pyrophosphoryl-undecaprenol N-acetylglucosamine transferase
MRMIFTGGGTGGHLYPALAIAREVFERQPQTDILFLIGTREIENRIIRDAGFEMKTLPVRGLPRKLSPAIIPFIVRLKISILKSLLIMKGFKPAIILATGGYVSGPPIIAAWIMGIPVIMQEQNSYPGITTKKLSRFAEMVFLGFQDAGRFFGERVKTIVTGNPVRKDILTGTRIASSKEFGFDPELKTVLIVGGSQGSRSINNAVAEIVKDIAAENIQVIWQTGMNEFEKWNKYDEYSEEKIKVVPYIDNIGVAYGATDIVVSRAGAIAVAEITACGLPVIFIPLPTAAENHQEYNARSLVNNGAASMILERNLTPETLKQEILGIITSEEKLKVMAEKSKKLGRTDAAGVIAESIIKQCGMN